MLKLKSIITQTKFNTVLVTSRFFPPGSIRTHASVTVKNMVSIISQVVASYNDIYRNADPRVEGWFMMASPVPSLLICLAYFLFVWISPAVMRKRKPMEIRELLVIYNLAMVVLSSYTFYEFLVSGWLAGYSLGCQPVDYSISPQALRMARACWLFYISKFIELLDTVFFILRKKFNQVSFLHVFHHGVMPISWWFGVKLVPGGFSTFHALLNSFIHLLMYTYYGLSALGPSFHKYLWWKRYMTKMQITQFVMVMLHSSQLLFMECNYPVFFVYWIGLYAIIFLVMFANFYIQAYRKPKRNHSVNSSKRNQTENGMNHNLKDR